MRICCIAVSALKCELADPVEHECAEVLVVLAPAALQGWCATAHMVPCPSLCRVLARL